MKKRLTALFLAFAMILVLLPAVALPASAETCSGTCGAEGDGSNLTWFLDTETGLLTIEGNGKMKNWTSSYIGTAWGYWTPWYRYRSSIKAVSLPSELTSIGDGAFYDCYNLALIDIPGKVTNIGNHAFGKCIMLTSITIPESVVFMPHNAFDQCSSLEKIIVAENNGVFSSNSQGVLYDKDKTTLLRCPCGFSGHCDIPSGVAVIEERAFYYCIKLKSVTIPEGVTKIFREAFSYCNQLSSVSIPDSIIHLDCTALFNTACYNSDENWQDGLLYIDRWVIDAKDDIVHAEVRQGTYGIADSAFHGFDELETITIPNSVRVFGVVKLCNSLKSVTIPNSVVVLGGFYFCPSLTSITIPDSVKSLGIFESCTGLTSITIPDSVTSLSANAFKDCTGLKSVRIGKGLQCIDVRTFFNCSSLATVTLAEGVNSFENYAFENCSKLTKINIPESVTEIHASAFAGCSSLESVTIPKSVTEIWIHAFSGCTGLRSIKILNKACAFINQTDDTLGVPGTTTISGYKGSTAQSYAEKYGYAFEVIGEDQCQNGHTWGSFVVYIQPTCTEPGTKTQTCTVCGATNTEEIKPLGHNYVNGVCSRCGATLTEAVRFSLQRNGWSFRNAAISFVDSEKESKDYRIPIERYQAVFGTELGKQYFNDNEEKPEHTRWGGNCSGMSATAIMFHSGILDWSEIDALYTNSFSYPNSYCKYWLRCASLDPDFIHYDVSAISGKDQAVTRLIEEYQLYACERYNPKYKSTIYPHLLETFFVEERIPGNIAPVQYGHREADNGGTYISEMLSEFQKAYANNTPLYIALVYNGGQHAIVSRTDIAPIEPGPNDNGWWKVCVYDPNRPYVNDDIIEAEKDSFSILPSVFVDACNDEINNGGDIYLELNPERNLWRYCVSNKSGEERKYHGCSEDGVVQYLAIGEENYFATKPEYFVTFSAEDFAPENDPAHPMIEPQTDMQGIVLSAGSTSDYAVYNQAGDPMILVKDGQVGSLNADAIELLNPGSSIEDGTYNGSAWLRDDVYTVQYNKGGLRLEGNNNSISIEASVNGEITVDCNNNTASIALKEEGDLQIKLSNVLSRDECSYVEGTGHLSTGQTFTISFDDNDGINASTTTGSGSIVLEYKAADADSAEHFATITDNTQVVPGDLNGDGGVDTVDSIRLAKYLVGLVELTDEQIKAADVTGDGDVTTTDAIRIAKYLVGLVESLKKGSANEATRAPEGAAIRGIPVSRTLR